MYIIGYVYTVIVIEYIAMPFVFSHAFIMANRLIQSLPNNGHLSLWPFVIVCNFMAKCTNTCTLACFDTVDTQPQKAIGHFRAISCSRPIACTLQSLM